MGNTTRGVVPLSIPWDHPHVYGEYEEETLHLHSFLGSPPRIWGIPSQTCRRMTSIGITPTYMGNTVLIQQIPQLTQDHPHVYGEYTKRLPANQAFAPSIPQFLFSLLI